MRAVAVVELVAFIENGTADHEVTAQAYTITVGAGGASVSSSPTQGNAGSNSIFDTITANGGGYGGKGVNGTGGASSNGSGGGGGCW